MEFRLGYLFVLFWFLVFCFYLDVREFGEGLGEVGGEVGSLFGIDSGDGKEGDRDFILVFSRFGLIRGCKGV